MLKYNFKYEFKLILRSRWIQTLSVVILLFIGLSTYNGTEKVKKRVRIISKAEKEIEKSDRLMLKLIDSVNQGFKVSAPRWTIPTSPMAVGNYHPRVVAKNPLPFSFIATGQSDLFTHIIKPTISGDEYAMNFTEMTSPIQLLLGSFDLNFVIVYLIPLLIIAFSYNILSKEKESGSILLLASQPIKLNTWLFQKLALRFFWMFILIFLSLTIIFSLYKIDLFLNFANYFTLLIHIIIYMLFWFVLVFLINLFVGNSAKNALSLIGLWITFVLLIPSILNQLGSTFYPIPSRTLMINEMRSKKVDVTEKQDKILDNFLRDHPEYGLNNAEEKRGYYHKYIASQQLIKEEMLPIINTYEKQLKNQQSLINTLKWFSPSLIMHISLNRLAGNSSDDYNTFRKQVLFFSEKWRTHLTIFLFNNQDFTVEDYSNLPKFKMKYEDYSFISTLSILFFISIFFLGIGFLYYGKNRIELFR